MSDGKWLRDLTPDMPVVAAARQTLLARLHPVRERLPPAVFQADEDPEFIHQLRVSTRRAGAALQIFAACLPTRLYNKTRKKLRGIRRAAGAARDGDVFLEALSQRRVRATAAQLPGIDVLFGITQGQRMAAQQALVQAVQKGRLDLETLINKTMGALEHPANLPRAFSLRDLAIPLLTTQLAQLDKAARGDLKNNEHLHQVRIAGKKLRYAMEVFCSCFEKSFAQKYYPAVEDMQEILGHANDSRVAIERLEASRARLQASQRSLWPRYQPGLEAVLRYHQRNLPQKRRQFVEWWHDWQQSGAEQAFASLFVPSP